MPSFVTMASIMDQARQDTDQVGSLNPPDSDLLNMGNRSFKKLYDLLVEAYGSDYSWKEYFFTTVQSQDVYPVPSDFYKQRLFDLQIQPGPPASYSPVQRFDEALRDSFNFGAASAIPTGAIFRVSYNPTAPTLSQYANTFLSCLEGGTGVTVQALYDGLDGQDVTLTVTTSGSAESVTSNVGNQTVTINIQSGVSTISSLAASIAANASALVTAIPSGPGGATFQAPNNFTAQGLGGTLEFDCVNGYERYIICDMAIMICRRLQLDPTSFMAEKAELVTSLTSLADTRDPGFPLVAKDNQLEALSMGPFSPFFNQRYGYIIQGSTFRLLRMGFM